MASTFTEHDGDDVVDDFTEKDLMPNTSKIATNNGSAIKYCGGNALTSCLNHCTVHTL